MGLLAFLSRAQKTSLKIEQVCAKTAAIERSKEERQLKIFIMGASGAGTTTLGAALSQELSLRHEDSDNFFWEQTDPPFTTPRDAEALHKLFYQYAKFDFFVLSGDILNWGLSEEFLLQCFSHLIYIYVPWEVRKARICEREELRFGKRIKAGGDMNLNFEAFIDWASHYETGLRPGRNMNSQLAFLEQFKLKNKRTLEILAPMSLEETLGMAINFLRQ